jgi:hypothetical protein
VAGDGKRGNIDEPLAIALAGGATVRDAAAKVGCGERTAYRRWADSAFRRKVAELRADMVRQTVGRLTSIGGQTLDALEALLKSTDDRVKLGAVRTVLEHTFKGVETAELADQLAELQRRLDEVTANGPCNTAAGGGAGAGAGRPDSAAPEPG